MMAPSSLLHCLRRIGTKGSPSPKGLNTMLPSKRAESILVSDERTVRVLSHPKVPAPVRWFNAALEGHGFKWGSRGVLALLFVLSFGINLQAATATPASPEPGQVTRIVKSGINTALYVTSGIHVVTAPSGGQVAMSNHSLAAGILSFDAVFSTAGTYRLNISTTYHGFLNGGPRFITIPDYIDVVVGPNTPPTISPITDRFCNEDASTGAISFTVADLQTSVGSLIVTSQSNNSELVDASSMVFSGTAGARSLVITPKANQYGTATITVNVTDGGSPPLTASTTFLLTVHPINDAPTLTEILPLQGAIEDIAFVVNYATLQAAANEADIDSATINFRVQSIANGTLRVRAAGSTATPTAVIAGSTILDASKELVWTPAANANALINAFTVRAHDGTLVSTTDVAVPVLVEARNDPPSITGFDPNGYINDEDTVRTIIVTVSDVETPAGQLIVSVSAPPCTVTVTGTGSTRTVVITPPLNFNTPVNEPPVSITYSVTDLGDGDSPPITIGPMATTIRFTPVNDAPTLTSVAQLSGALPGVPRIISYSELKQAADEDDVDTPASQINFRIQHVSNGSLGIRDAGSTGFDSVSVNPGSTILTAAKELVWTPALGADGVRTAFRIRAHDGALVSAADVPVTFNVGPIAPVITHQPTSRSVVQGYMTTFLVGATGAPNPSFQWFRNEGAIPGATASSYAITATPGDSGAVFHVVVSNSAGSVTSAGATLTVYSSPVIAQQPASQSVTHGQPAIFSVMANGEPAPTFQWQRNDVAVDGATSSTYTTPNTTVADSGAVYRVVVSNAYGTVTSANATLTVVAPPTITAQPVAQSALHGQTATFTVTAMGSPLPDYQWRKNGTDILGATSASYAVAVTPVDNAAEFSVVVSNSLGSVTSADAALTVWWAPAITTEPLAQSVMMGETATFTVGAHGNPSPAYQWRQNGVDINGATAASFTTPPTTAADAGALYSVVVSNPHGSVTSAATTLGVVNAAPTVDTAARATPNPVTGTTALLSVVGADDMGEAALTYTWSTTGTPPVTFSHNETNAARQTTATFPAAGIYELVATIADAHHLTVTSAVEVTVLATPTTVTMTPATVRLNPGAQQTFAAQAYDQFGVAMSAEPTFTMTPSGTVTASGEATAPSEVGTYMVHAEVGGATGTATLVVNAAPTVAMAASATPNPVTGTTTTVAMLGADDAGEEALTYHWSATGDAPAAVAFSINDTNDAKQSVVTFAKAGTYQLQVAIRDGLLLETTTGLTVTVDSTVAQVGVTPATAMVNPAQTQPFTATAVDQFGDPVPVAWTVSGGGTIEPNNGLFTAGATAGGPHTVTATAGAMSGTSSVMVNAAPTIPVVPSASPNPVTGTTTTVTVLGAHDAGETTLTYHWSTLGAVPAPVSFSVNGTNAAKQSIATFAQAGLYELQVVIRDALHLEATANVTVAVHQTIASISVMPSSVILNPLETHLFAAVARDQFGMLMAIQPTFTWSIDGGGSVSAQGLCTAGTTAGGPHTVTAMAEDLVGTASATVNEAPLIVAPAFAHPNPVTGTTAVLSVRATDDGGEGLLTYTWTTVGVPPAPVAYSVNGTHVAQDTTVTLSAAGHYDFEVTVSDAKGLTATSAVTVLVVSTPTTVAVTPLAGQVLPWQSITYTGSVLDQFGLPVNPQPMVTWTVAGGGSMASAGVFTAGGSMGGPHVVSAVSAGAHGSATVVIANDSPTIAMAPTLSQNPVTGSTVQVAVLGADDGGESALTYQWSTVGSLPAAVSFSDNATNAAKSVVATFAKVGLYTVRVTITDAFGAAATTDMSVQVHATPTSLAVVPSTTTVPPDGTQPFLADFRDQFAAPMAPALVTWSASGGGTISTDGVFHAGSSFGGPYTITGVGAGLTGTASLTIANMPPTVAIAASSNPHPVTGTTASLSVLGADDAGESALTYTWSNIDGIWPAVVAFSPNGSYAAQATTATFGQAGTYRLRCVIRDAQGLSVQSDVTVLVQQSLNGLTLHPAHAAVSRTGHYAFRVVGRDQFNRPFATMPDADWTSTFGSITAQGIFSAGGVVGAGTVTATIGGVSVSGTVVTNDFNAPPTITQEAAASATEVTGTHVDLTIEAVDDEGPRPIVYTWLVSDITPGRSQPAVVTVTPNASTAAHAATAGFTKPGTYTFRCILNNSRNAGNISNVVTVTVTDSPTSISVAPTPIKVAAGATQSFTATVRNQFGDPVASQPAKSWSVSGGGSANSAGLLTASAADGGPYEVRATVGNLPVGVGVFSVGANQKPTHGGISVTPNPPTSNRFTLSVATPNDDMGIDGITYTWGWITSQSPAGGKMYVRRDNGTRTAQSMDVAVDTPGEWTFAVHVKDQNGQFNYTINDIIVVNVAFAQDDLFELRISPTLVSPNPGGSHTFVANVFDVVGHYAISPRPTMHWETSGGGSISASGTFTAEMTPGGPYTVTASTTYLARSYSGTAQVRINAPPSIVIPPSPEHTPMWDKTVRMSVRGEDDDGEPNLRYIWSRVSGPAPVTFSSINGTNGARNLTATFSRRGEYVLRATATDRGEYTASAECSVIIANTPPVVSESSLFMARNTAKSEALVASDPDGDALTYLVLRPPRNGRLAFAGKTFTYTPHQNFTGMDDFVVIANDGFLDSQPATQTLFVGIDPTRSLLVAANAFDTEAWHSDPLYRSHYLGQHVPGRVWQTMPGAAGAATLEATGPVRLKVATGADVMLSVRGSPHAPVSFALTGMGSFGGVTNAKTVQADASGVASIILTLPGAGKTPILVGSPLAVGNVRFVVEVSP